MGEGEGKREQITRSTTKNLMIILYVHQGSYLGVHNVQVIFHFLLIKKAIFPSTNHEMSLEYYVHKSVNPNVPQQNSKFKAPRTLFSVCANIKKEELLPLLYFIS